MTIASFACTAALVCASLFATGAAHAVYRCGNVYQDRPCDGGGEQPHLTPGKSAAPPPPASATPLQSTFAVACARIGQAAQQMVWKREGGATQEAQLADLPTAGSRDEMIRTLDSVYRKRGSAPSIRAAVEAECVAEKQLEADTAAAIKALQSKQPATSAAPPASPAAAAPASADAAAVKNTAAPSGPSPSCPWWRRELNSINDDFRKGGNAAAMERLQNRRRDVEKTMREGRC